MDFGDYDDFSHDNNPFAGSNHFYSNGILSADADANANANANGNENDNNSENNSDYDNNDNENINNIEDKNSYLVNPFEIVQSSKDENKEENVDNKSIHSFLSSSSQIKESAMKVPNNKETKNNISYEQIINNDNNINNNTSNTDIETINEQATLYVNSIYNENNIRINGYEILNDYKNVKAVFYRIELSTKVNVLRRYSDFVSLRLYLIRFFPTKIIPPIPEKHSLSRLIKNPFNYKTDVQIIERRIRLLNYFLKKLINDSLIRDSQVLAKFFDPLEKNFSRNLDNSPFKNLSTKSILLISPKNPTKPNPFLSYLPVPPIRLIKNFNSSLTLNLEVFQPIEIKVKKLFKIASKLENLIKIIINDFEKNKNSMIELGGFFNIFSIIEEQNFSIEKFGNKIDLTFLNIEILINSITIKIKEPLNILKLTLISIIKLLHFRKLKEFQLNYFQELILHKQIKLKKSIEVLNSEIKLNELLNSIDHDNNNAIKSPSLNRAIIDLKNKRSKLLNSKPNSYAIPNSNISDSSMMIDSHSILDPDDESDRHSTSFSTIDNNLETNNNINNCSINSINFEAISKSNNHEVIREIKNLNSELNTKLIPCFNNLLNDVEFISVEIENNINNELNLINSQLTNIMYDWKNEVYGEFLYSCLKVWESNKK